jgi:hypothetical protein
MDPAARIAELEAENKMLTERLAAAEASNGIKPKKPKAKIDRNSPIATAAATLLNPMIPDNTVVKHVAGKKGTEHIAYAKMLGGKFRECDESGEIVPDGKIYTSSPSNFGSAHYKTLMADKHPSVSKREKDSCNGWIEVEYRKEDGSWAKTDELRPKEAIKHVKKAVELSLDQPSNAAAASASAAVPPPVEKVVVRRKKLVKIGPVPAPESVPVPAAESVPVPSEVPVPVEAPAEPMETDENDEVPPDTPFTFCITVEEKKIFTIFQENQNWNEADFLTHLNDDPLDEFKDWMEITLVSEDLDLANVDFLNVRNEMRAYKDVLVSTE